MVRSFVLLSFLVLFVSSCTSRQTYLEAGISDLVDDGLNKTAPTGKKISLIVEQAVPMSVTLKDDAWPTSITTYSYERVIEGAILGELGKLFTVVPPASGVPIVEVRLEQLEAWGICSSTCSFYTKFFTLLTVSHNQGLVGERRNQSQGRAGDPEDEWSSYDDLHFLAAKRAFADMIEELAVRTNKMIIPFTE